MWYRAPTGFPQDCALSKKGLEEAFRVEKRQFQEMGAVIQGTLGTQGSKSNSVQQPGLQQWQQPGGVWLRQQQHTQKVQQHVQQAVEQNSRKPLVRGRNGNQFFQS